MSQSAKSTTGPASKASGTQRSLRSDSKLDLASGTLAPTAQRTLESGYPQLGLASGTLAPTAQRTLEPGYPQQTLTFGSLAPTDQRNLDAGYPQRKLAQGPNLIEQFHLGENENVNGKNSSVAELEHDALSKHMERLPNIFWTAQCGIKRLQT